MRKHEKKILDIFLSQRSFLKGIAYRYAPGAEYLDDILQQVFLEFLRKWKSERPTGEIEPLLVAMTKNIALRHWREHVRKQPEALAILSTKLQERSADTEPNLYEDEIEKMRRCIELLPDKQQRIVRMHYFEDCSVQEISEQLEIKLSTLYHILFRVRQTLKSCLTKGEEPT